MNVPTVKEKTTRKPAWGLGFNCIYIQSSGEAIDNAPEKATEKRRDRKLKKEMKTINEKTGRSGPS
ncbi:hypothetical protein [Salinimonas chungwhensis]|uniref:hypothetical protein n=1 Tax=Salinimonas chungwhensis TaxID=265425 RepID=UPI00035D4FF2|nr:hypothetical protein [Salinimonas chungwhensis]